MYSLFIDSSSKNCVHLALWQKHKLGLYLTKSELPAKLLNELISQTSVKLTQLSFITTILGPGSYTSLRVGIASIKALAYALKIPIIALDWFQIRAELFSSENLITPIPIIHAIHEFFCVQSVSTANNNPSPIRLAKNELLSFAQNFANPMYLPIVLEAENFPKLGLEPQLKIDKPLFIQTEYQQLIHQIQKLSLSYYNAQIFSSPQQIKPLYFGPVTIKNPANVLPN